MMKTDSKKQDTPKLLINPLYKSTPIDDLIPEEVLKNILDTGLVVVGSKGTGKSNVVKCIVSEIIKRNLNIQCKIFDTCCNWRNSFEPIPMQELNESSYLTPIYNGKESILFDVQYDDPELIEQKIGEMVYIDFRDNRLKKNIYGSIPDWKLYIIEEAQNVLNTYSLNKKDGRMWLKSISEGRNFNLGFIFIGQRLADISTKVIERAQGYLFGKMTGDNDLKKVKDICSKKIANRVKELKQGEFIYYSGKKQIQLLLAPEYTSNTKPILYTPKMGRWVNIE